MYPIPSWDLREEKKEQFRRSIAEAGIHRALHLAIAESRDGLVVRQLLASDLGLEAWRTPKQAAGERSDWISHQLAPYQIIVIYKVIQLSIDPHVSRITFFTGANASTVRSIIEVDEIYGVLPILKKMRTYGKAELLSIFGKLEKIKMEAFFSEPLVYDAGCQIDVVVKSPEGHSGDSLMLGGVVIEKVGATVAEG